MITVVGLGVDKDQITLAGVKEIIKAKKVFVKTALTETFSYFEENNINVTTFDYIYEQAEDFSNLDEKIVEILLNEKDVVFCVNGSGYDDRAVKALSQKTYIKIVPSVSLGTLFEKPALNMLKISAYELIDSKGFNYDTRGSLCIVDIDNELIASDVKLILSNILGDEQDIRFNDKQIKIYEIDRQGEYNYKTTIFVDPIELTKKQRFNFYDLYQIMIILRSEHGCEWDKAQTHESIRENIIEEAYELVEAINNQDVDNMIEECGDLMLESIFQSVIGESMGEFNTDDAISGICSKLIFRHPHVFGDIKATNEEEALRAWDSAKAKEKHYTSLSSKMDSITNSLPALMKIDKILSVLKKANIKFETTQDAQKYFEDELKKFKNSENEDSAGDLLLALTWLLKTYKIEPEIALSKSMSKVIEKFKKLEKDGLIKETSNLDLWMNQDEDR